AEVRVAFRRRQVPRDAAVAEQGRRGHDALQFGLVRPPQPVAERERARLRLQAGKERAVADARPLAGGEEHVEESGARAHAAGAAAGTASGTTSTEITAAGTSVAG